MSISIIGPMEPDPDTALREMLLRLHAALTEVVQALPDDPAQASPSAKPATRGGIRRIIARYLAEKGEGYIFTVAELEKEGMAQTGRHRVEIDRRLRELREVRWVIGSCKTDPDLLPDQLRVVRIGDEVWNSHYRWPTGLHPTGSFRRFILGRDDYTCQICGVKAGQEYPDAPGRRARLTVGRILPGSRGGKYIADNCRAECDRCQETQDRYDYGE